MNTGKKVLFFGLMALWGTSAFGAEIVVDPGGSGDATTIQGGLDLATTGDLVTVLPGTYVENLTMTPGVTLASQAGAAMTVIDGSGDMCINCENCGPGTRVTGFTLTKGGGYIGGGIRIFDHSRLEIDKNVFLENHTSFEGAGVSVQLFSVADIHDNDFIGNISFKTAAITVIQNAQATITRNFFKGNVSTTFAAVVGVNQSSVVLEDNRIVENSSGGGGAAVDLYEANCQMRNNTFIRNLAPSGGSCLNVSGASSLVAENNLFAHNGGGGPAIFAWGCQNFFCNIFWDNGVDYVGPCSPLGSDGNEHLNPLVCHPGRNDCAVSEFSPCLNGPCGTIGAVQVPDCTDDVVTVETSSWGSLKSLYR